MILICDLGLSEDNNNYQKNKGSSTGAHFQHVTDSKTDVGFNGTPLFVHVSAVSGSQVV